MWPQAATFRSKSCGCGVDAALVPHYAGFRGLQIALPLSPLLIRQPASLNPPKTRRNTGQAAGQ